MKQDQLVKVLDEVLPVRNYFRKQLEKDLAEAEAEMQAAMDEMGDDVPPPGLIGGRGRARGRGGSKIKIFSFC